MAGCVSRPLVLKLDVEEAHEPPKAGRWEISVATFHRFFLHNSLIYVIKDVLALALVWKAW